MKSPKMRAIIASEHPDLRKVLTGVVERDMGAVTAGQADNAVKAIALARTLRPDLMLVDYRLPHVAGLDQVRLSRIGGLDTAMAVSQELPKARIFVVSNVELAPQAGDRRRTIKMALYGGAGAAALPVSFADVRARDIPSLRQDVLETSERVMMLSGLTILGGLGLMLTIILAAAGAYLAMAGAAVFLLSLAVRSVAALWPKLAHSPASYDSGELPVRDVRA